MEQAKQSALPNPGILYQTCLGFWNAQTIYVVTKLKVFTSLSEKSLTIDEITSLLELPIRTTEALLNACCSLGLLQKDNSRYTNTSVSEQYLVAGNDMYLGYYILFAGEMLYPYWGTRLSD